MISKIQYKTYDKANEPHWKNTGMLFDDKSGTLSYDKSKALGTFVSFFQRLSIGDQSLMQYEYDDMDDYYDNMKPLDRNLYIATPSGIRQSLSYKDIKKVQLPNNETDVSIGIYHIKDIIGDGTFFMTEAGYTSYFITYDRLYMLEHLTLLDEEDDYNDFSNIEPSYNRSNNHITVVNTNFSMYVKHTTMISLESFTTNNADYIKDFDTLGCSFYFIKGTPYLEMDKDEIIENLNKKHKKYTAYIYYGDTDENGKLHRRY